MAGDVLHATGEIPSVTSPPELFEQFHTWVYLYQINLGSVLPRLYSDVLKKFRRIECSLSTITVGQNDAKPPCCRTG